MSSISSSFAEKSSPGSTARQSARVDGRRHRDPDEGEPDRSEDHGEHGEGRVVPHEEGRLEPPVGRNAAAEHRQVQGAQREHPPPGHGPFRGEPVVQVSVGGEQQYCKGYVRRVYHLVDVERVQPGERGNRPGRTSVPRHRPWPHGAARPAPAGRSSAGRREARWPLCSLDSGLVSIRLDYGRWRLECDLSLHPARWPQPRNKRVKVGKPVRWKYPSSAHSFPKNLVQ